MTLPYAFATSFRQDAVYDDESGTDWYLLRFDLSFQAVLNYNYMSLIAPDLFAGSQPITQNPAAIMKIVRNRLLKPRQKLSVKMNGVELMPDPLGTCPIDAKNGPQPQSCVITQMTNTTFLCTYHVIAHYWENNLVNLAAGSGGTLSTNQPGNDVLFNRWTESVDIDHANFTKRTRRGKFVIRSDNVSGRLADQIRSQMAVVGVPPNFLRESASYEETPDGLAVRYTIVDKQSFRMPPQPAFRASGDYTETATKMGAVRYGDVRVALEGDSSDACNQANLLETAIAVAVSKTHVGGNFKGSQYLLNEADVRVSLYENKVECHIRTMITADSGRVQGIAGFDTADLTNVPFSEGSVPKPAYYNRGTAGILLQAAAYYDPSLQSTQLNANTGQLSAGVAVGMAGSNCSASSTPGTPFTTENPLTPDEIGQATVTTVATITPDDNQADFIADPASSTTMFTDYRMNNRYEHDKHIYMMPISSPGGFQGASVGFVQLASPTLLWVSDWTAARYITQPIAPDPTQSDPNWVLLDVIPEPAMVTVGPDGVSPLYRLSGTYVYGHKNPDKNVFNNIMYARPPWLLDNFERTMPTGLLAQNIINIQGGGTSSLTTVPPGAIAPGQ